MEVILSSDVKGVGKKGDVVKVSDGYGRNYLLPRGLAKEATAGNVRQVEVQKEKLRQQKETELVEARMKAQLLEGKHLIYVTKAGDNGRLFGAITNKDLAASIEKEFGLDIDKKKIELKDTIKAVGEYEVRVKLYPNVSAALKVLVRPEE